MNGITNNNDIIPTFDYTGKIRILESSNFEQSQQLKDQCREFVDKITEFSNIVGSFLDLLKEKSEQIEKEKLKAIGLRNKAEKEAENRKILEQRLLILIKERKAEFDRLTAQYESLVKIEQEQTSFIETLSGK
ncbi:intraflagellar transport protein 20 [Neocallimastix lanati (nom. inval.)]|uniref:Uncharacterized protein n=1 Tax=Neocallimastix californiae TaxID=1754190 RepID=A0A1Y2EG88_9FUNG|nr:intraflagellar transport protein 20 [Neocallimastix sp. JGI-2020a]ORY70591.1 hypothetical protein LY90DRAFT_667432 [Neocallimastix californiae]|eukprot:ORY70591.1 hypothetical protein LY90DRAFT_667432 [Neocallimastix californiae]